MKIFAKKCSVRLSTLAINPIKAGGGAVGGFYNSPT